MQPKKYKKSEKVFWGTGKVSLIGARYYIDDDSAYGYCELDINKNCEIFGNIYGLNLIQ